MRTNVLAAAMLMAGIATADAQTQIEWKQTSNIPKGQHIAREQGDMLGIEFGDSYAEAKAKLEKLDAEGIPPAKLPECTRYSKGPCGKAEPRVTEERKIFDLRAPGHSVITASYVGVLKLSRRLPGKGSDPITEQITLFLSAPSSGHQVVAMHRDIYYSDADQPQISDLVDALKVKFKTEPLITGNSVSFQFDNGKPAARRARPVDCRANVEAMSSLESVQQVNPKGDCDVVMVLDVIRGVSQNHARIIKFAFGDNDRLKANSIADFTFIRDYVNSLQDRKLGVTPKL